MAEMILIDLTKYRIPFKGSCDNTPPEGLFYPETNSNGLKTIRELAVFRFACRRCSEAPCIDVCPAEALEKDDGGIVTRYTNLCVSCKSCVAACPFGTMMTDFFEHHREKDNYFDLTDEADLQKFIDSSPEGIITIVDMDEDPDRNIYKLNDRILVKEFPWDPDNLNKN